MAGAPAPAISIPQYPLLGSANGSICQRDHVNFHQYVLWQPGYFYS